MGKGQEAWIRFDGSGRSFAAFRAYPLLPGAAPGASGGEAVPTPAGTTEIGRRMEGTRSGEKRIFDGIEMVWCAPGEFLMGSPVTEEGRSSDETQHRVKFSKGFWLGKAEVTQGQWETVMGTTVTSQRDLENPDWGLSEVGGWQPILC